VAVQLLPSREPERTPLLSAVRDGPLPEADEGRMSPSDEVLSEVRRRYNALIDTLNYGFSLGLYSAGEYRQMRQMVERLKEVILEYVFRQE